MFIITCGHRYKYTEANLCRGPKMMNTLAWDAYPPSAKGYFENQTVHKKGSVEIFSSMPSIIHMYFAKGQCSLLISSLVVSVVCQTVTRF